MVGRFKVRGRHRGGGRKGVGALILAVPGPGARGWVENGADGEGGTGWLFCRLDPNFASPASPRPLPEDPTLPPAPAPAPALSNELRGWKPPPRLPRPPSTLGPSLFLFFASRHAARHVPLPLHFPHLIRPAAIPTRGDEAGPKDKTGSVMGGKTCNAWPPRNIYHKGRIRPADSCREMLPSCGVDEFSRHDRPCPRQVAAKLLACLLHSATRAFASGTKDHDGHVTIRWHRDLVPLSGTHCFP